VAAPAQKHSKGFDFFSLVGSSKVVGPPDFFTFKVVGIGLGPSLG
jgi:hypothetical protein